MKRLSALAFPRSLAPGLVLAMATLLPAAAMANITPTGTSITGAVGGPYTWTYQLNLAAEADAITGPSPASPIVPHSDLSYGAFVTIYDFAGYVAGTCSAPSGWTCTAQNLGFTPDDVLPFDNPLLPNLTWTHTSGPTISGQPSGIDLGLFSAQSIYGNEVLVSYVSRTLKNQGSAAGTIADNVGNTRGPTGDLLDVPEPGSLALAGLGLALLGMRARKARAPTQTA